MTTNIHRILVPTDFSGCSARAVDYATGLAGSLGASLHLIHVLNGLVTAEKPWDRPGVSAVMEHEHLYQQSRERLAASTERIRDQVPAATFEVRSGIVANEIAKAAIDYGADLVVLATHGRTGLPHLVLGSVAEDVIRQANCPVLTVRDTQKRGIPPVEESVLANAAA